MNTKRKTLKMPVRYLMNLVLVGLLFVGLSYVTGNMLSTYQNKVLLTVGINIILAVSLNVATGYLGQLPLGHAGFMAVGAYACALFTKSSGLPKGVAFAIGLVLAWVIAGLFGVLIGIPALRLTGDYLAILTLGFGEIIRITLNNIDDVLGFKLFYGLQGPEEHPQVFQLYQRVPVRGHYLLFDPRHDEEPPRPRRAGHPRQRDRRRELRHPDHLL